MGALLCAVPSIALAHRPLAVSADGCPNLEQVTRALHQLLPKWQMDGGPDSIGVRVDDQGDRYRVVVGQVDRTLEDPARGCDARADAAAVIAELMLMPPSLPKRKTGGVIVDLAAVGFLDLAPAASNLPTTGGGGLRLNVGGKWIGATVGLSGLAPAHLTFEDHRSSLVRAPIDLGVYSSYRHRAFEVGGELGLLLTPLVLYRSGLSSQDTAPKLESGVRLRPEVRWWLRDWFAVTFAVSIDVAFHTYTLDIQPVGQVGETPRFWTELALGVLFRLKK